MAPRLGPDLTELDTRPPDRPVLGWRYWQLEPRTQRLRSISHRRIQWVPGEPMRGVCLSGGHAAPSPGCACGVHASPTREQLVSDSLCLSPTVPLVLGEVALWGRLVADAHGLRAEWAAPARLWLVDGTDLEVPQPVALGWLAAYGVPVATMPAEEAVGEISATILANLRMSS